MSVERAQYYIIGVSKRDGSLSVIETWSKRKSAMKRLQRFGGRLEMFSEVYVASSKRFDNTDFQAKGLRAGSRPEILFRTIQQYGPLATSQIIPLLHGKGFANAHGDFDGRQFYSCLCRLKSRGYVSQDVGGRYKVIDGRQG